MANHFDDEKREYVIEDMFPRRDWLNYLWNSNTVLCLTQFGDGNAFTNLGSTNRQIDAGPRYLYVRNGNNGKLRAMNRNFSQEKFDRFECHVGIGYHTVLSEVDGIRSELTFLVPTIGRVVLAKATVTNISSKTLPLDIAFLCHPTVVMGPHTSYGEGHKAKDGNYLLYTYEGYRIPRSYDDVVLGSALPFEEYEVSEQRLLRGYRTYANPLPLEKGKLASQGSDFDASYVGVIMHHVTLKPGERFENVYAYGAVNNEDEAKSLVHDFASLSRFDKELKEIQKKAKQYDDCFHVVSPDPILNSQVNLWLKRQLSLGKDWGRIYGKGFRDVTQDCTAFASLDPALARTRILEILKHQYEDGNPIRMYEPDFTYPYNDGASWIPAALYAYLAETGDKTILEEKLPYLPGTTESHWDLSDAFVYRAYQGTSYQESVLAHVKRGMDHLAKTRGEHGLVLFLGGDWNDSLNAAGLAKKGESVWLSIATVKAYNEWIEILRFAGKEEWIPEATKIKEEIRHAILADGQSDGHLIYGYTDEGKAIGAKDSEGPTLFLNPQTWAVLASLTSKEQLEKYMDQVEETLRCPFGYRLCYPSYTKGDDTIGRVSYFKPGLVENGSVYNHGVAFKMVADCMLGRGDKAYETYRLIRYDNPKNPDNGMEPYAWSNMYIGPDDPNLAGYAPMSWITGTAGWIYRALTQYLFGIRPTLEGLLVDPCLPSSWKEAEASREFRGTIYHFHFLAGEKVTVKEDGKEVPNGLLLPDERKERWIEVAFKAE